MTTARVRIPTPHPGQRRVRRSDAANRVLMCGRRWGKTEHGIAEACEDATSGLAVGWFGPTFKITDEAWRRIDAILAPVTVRRNAQMLRLDIAGGGSIEFWSLDKPDAGRSRAYDKAIIDEAGLVRNLLEAWNGAIRPTLTDRFGRSLFLGTPKGRGDFYRLFSKGEAGDPGWASFRLPTIDNPHIPAEYVEEARRDMPPEVFAQEYEGKPADDGGNPFGLDSIARCIGQLSTSEPVVWGVDLAKSIDWTVALALDEFGAVCRFERWQRRPWDRQRADLIELIGKTPAYLDSTGVGDPVVEDITRECPKAEGFKFTSTSKQQIMEGLAAAIQREQITVPDGVIRAELEQFQYEYRGSRVSYEAPSGFHDDAVCALALAVHGAGEIAKRPKPRVTQIRRKDPVLAGAWR